MENLDTIHEILVRLPTKSAVRFNCVCKTWESLISSSDFIKSHQKHSLETTSNLSLLFCPSAPEGDDFQLGDVSWLYRAPVLNRALGPGHKLYLPAPLIKSASFGYYFVGSCNGLICIRTIDFLALINPLTRVFKCVPFSDVFDYSNFNSRVCYGFGYDSQGDDYKIVGAGAGCVLVYSLGNQSWKTIPFPGLDRIVHPFGGDNVVFLNGRLHWVLCRVPSILTLDLHHEEWHHIPMPNYNYDLVKNIMHRQLGVLDGCLCVTYSIRTTSSPLCPSFYKEGASHVWVMNEYGVGESWTMFFSLPFPRAMPLMIIKQQHEVLLTKGCYEDAFSSKKKKGLYLWNIEEQTLREIEGPKVNYSHVEVCVDSLCVNNLDPLSQDIFTLDDEDEENYKKQGRNKTSRMITNEFLIEVNEKFSAQASLQKGNQTTSIQKEFEM